MSTRRSRHTNVAAAQGFANIVVRSLDMDVAVLACGLSHEIPATILFRTGTKHQARYIDMTSMGKKFGADVCLALIGLHAFTGCVTTSAFVGHGKKVGFDLVVNDSPFKQISVNTLSMLGSHFIHVSQLMKLLEAFTCRLYGSHVSMSINDVRYQQFCARAAQSS